MGVQPIAQRPIRTEVENLAEDHWEWIAGLLKTDSSSRLTIESAKYLYTSAFIHGWKHAMKSKKPMLLSPKEATTL